MVGLFSAVTFIVPLLLPEVGETVHQEASLLTFQLVLDVISNVFCSPGATKLREEAFMDKVGADGLPACDTPIN